MLWRSGEFAPFQLVVGAKQTRIERWTKSNVISQVLISAAGVGGTQHVYNAAPSRLGRLPSHKPKTYRLELLDPLDACIPPTAHRTRSGAAFMAVRGNCTFSAKAAHAQAAGAELLIVFDTSPGEFSGSCRVLAVSDQSMLFKYSSRSTLDDRLALCWASVGVLASQPSMGF